MYGIFRGCRHYHLTPVLARTAKSAASEEIPLYSRVAFLLGMIYSYFSARAGGGPRVSLTADLLQAGILTATWLAAHLALPAHASVWCAANALQGVTIVLEPVLFSVPPAGPGAAELPAESGAIGGLRTPSSVPRGALWWSNVCLICVSGAFYHIV